MSKKPTDEKFISIEYDVWFNKYKPMEEQLKYQSEKIKELEKQNTISIVVAWREYNYTYQQHVGTIDITIVNDHPNVTVKHTDAIKNIIDSALHSYSSHKPGDRRFITTEDLKEYEKEFAKLDAIEKQLTRRSSEFLQELRKQKEERRQLEKDKTAIRLPKFLSKLFKLK